MPKSAPLVDDNENDDVDDDAFKKLQRDMESLETEEDDSVGFDDDFFDDEDEDF